MALCVTGCAKCAVSMSDDDSHIEIESDVINRSFSLINLMKTRFNCVLFAGGR